MLFRQLFERETSTYTYLLAGGIGGEALLIDPVKDEVGKYLQLIDELDLRLVFALDTHVHADHVTGLGQLRLATNCVTIMGAQSKADCVSRKVVDGKLIETSRFRPTSHAAGHDGRRRTCRLCIRRAMPSILASRRFAAHACARHARRCPAP